MANGYDKFLEMKGKYFPNGYSKKHVKTGKDYRFSARGQREFRRGFMIAQQRTLGA